MIICVKCKNTMKEHIVYMMNDNKVLNLCKNCSSQLSNSIIRQVNVQDILNKRKSLCDNTNEVIDVKTNKQRSVITVYKPVYITNNNHKKRRLI